MATSSLSMLPEEIELEVLMQLPVKSILRFSAVCRRWAALLSSEDFRAAWTKLAESASTTTQPAAHLLFLPLTPWTAARSTITKVLCGDGRPLLTLDGVRDLSAVMAPAPCRGLTLLHDTVSGQCHVFNAATRAAATLPPPPSCHDGTLTQLIISTAGLGFDERSKEHKVVRLVSSGDPAELRFRFRRIRCEVHTLGGGPGRRWRPHTSSADADGVVVPSTLAGSALLATLVSNPAPVFVDGFLHWLVDTTFDNPTAGGRRSVPPVLSFSLAQETFSRWIRPTPFDWDVYSGTHLAELDGKLCMVRDLRGGGSNGRLEIWSYGAAADGGANDVWTLEHRIDLAQHAGRHLLIEPRYIRVLGSSVGNRMIFVATSKGNVVAYDPMCGTLETVLQLGGGTSRDESRRSLGRFSLFKQSLTPVH